MEIMKQIGRILKTIFWLVTILAMILSLTVATYAWFTSNRVTTTDSVSTRSGSDTVELQISSTGGSSFQSSEEARILQVNQTVTTNLQPVSSADLSTFVYNPKTVNDVASTFLLVTNEEYFYHGRVYIQAVATGQQMQGKMALYLDQSSNAGGVLAQTDRGDLLKATRLGLTFDSTNPVIFKLSEETSDNQVQNTMVDGKLLKDNQVLKYSKGKVEAVTDPSVLLSQYTISIENNTVNLPEKPLTYLELNKIYIVDIYFYLEGCDPDCSDSVSYDGADLHLAFYGILES
jgi:hypothetical protein